PNSSPVSPPAASAASAGEDDPCGLIQDDVCLEPDPEDEACIQQCHKTCLGCVGRCRTSCNRCAQGCGGKWSCSTQCTSQFSTCPAECIEPQGKCLQRCIEKSLPK
ncbi:MAG TPA: hypothetical protein PKD61_39710, partial [Polyangiaceae bacterium]|nr:hypothetical protein [Polyangiaceae bacterium]